MRSVERLPGLTSGVRVPARRAGFTLVELLVVVFILLLVSAASLPIIVPALQGRHVREASRQINSYFAVARDTALRTGRPVGVSIERFVSRDPAGNVVGAIGEMSVVLQQVEVPQPYSGDFPTSRMVLEYQVNPAGDVNSVRIVGLRTSDFAFDIGWEGLIRVGDRVRFNSAGRWYEISGEGKDGNSLPTRPGDYLTATPSGDAAPAETYWKLSRVDGNIPWYLPPGAQDVGSNCFRISVPYTIIRQPVKTSVPPLQLTGTVILDLNWSRDERACFTERAYDDPSAPTAVPKLLATLARGSSDPPAEDIRPITIMFGTSGALERVYRSEYQTDSAGTDPPWWGYVDFRPSGPIHLLVGQREAVPANPTLGDAEQATNNWRNLDNLWVSIHPQTGLITTTENAEVAEPASADPYPNVINGGGLRAARYFATRAKSMGGR